MIEVNLLPTKGKQRGPRVPRRSFALPKLPSGMPQDRWVLTAGALAAISLIMIAWLFFTVRGAAEELQVRIEVAQSDSVRFADIIRQTEHLQARRDSIAQRVAVIQEIDGKRYVWAHVMDEIGRALPDYTWILRLQQVATTPDLYLRIQGRTATYFALTDFMTSLEASPFLADVRLVSSSSEVLTVGPGARRLILGYTLEARYQEPPPEAIDRVPLFGPSVAIPGASDGEEG